MPAQVIPNYSSREDYEEMYLTGVSQYGQMTAGSFCYIGPQGIVHGTTLTLLNAGRKYLGTGDSLKGKLFVTAGLGGMSGAQAKAAVVCGAVKGRPLLVLRASADACLPCPFIHLCRFSGHVCPSYAAPPRAPHPHIAVPACCCVVVSKSNCALNGGRWPSWPR